MRILVAPLLLMLAAPTVAKDGSGFRKAELEGMTPAELATALLPPELKGNFVERQLISGLAPEGNYLGVRLIAAPRRSGQDVCLRDAQYVSLTPVAGRSYETFVNDAPARPDRNRGYFYIALAKDCSSADTFAHVNSGSEEMAARLLRYVVDLREAARKDRAFAVSIECRSELTPNPCERDIRQVVANLPAEKPRIINKLWGSQGKGWEVALSDRPLPSAFWQVRIDDDPDRVQHVTLSWMVPPPF